VERGADLRYPVVLDRCDDVPRSRQLQIVRKIGPVAKVRVIDPAEPDFVGVGQAPSNIAILCPPVIEVAAVKGGADTVLALNREGIALGEPAPPKLIQVQLSPGHARPTRSVAGMGVTGNQTIGEVALVEIPRPDIMPSARDLRAAPGLIDPDGANNVRDKGAGILLFIIVGNPAV